ncbi:hypothetical protein [Sphingopyxis sp.]|uniref:hypothetical protein n=1 Tax=Sphingopyxis sp. TaxID=1908224 RepID=UPI0025E8F7E7|nr:hypothetical protein [Sphingopyxis sp.]MBK6413656.1 hypothetical protein [Sphingopyxis sp.]
MFATLSQLGIIQYGGEMASSDSGDMKSGRDPSFKKPTEQVWSWHFSGTLLPLDDCLLAAVDPHLTDRKRQASGEICQSFGA